MSFDSEHEISFLGGVWKARLKAKDIYRQLRNQRQILLQKYSRKKLHYNSGLIIIPVNVLFIIIVSFLGGFPYPIDTSNVTISKIILYIMFFVLVVTLSVTVVLTFESSSALDRIKEDAKRFGVLGLISEKIADECSLVDLYADFGNPRDVEPYRSERSPYSGKRKLYYYLPWLRYDTNLQDGTKFLLKGAAEIKTKSNIIIRSISKFNFCFSFAVHEDEYLNEEKLRELEKQIGQLTFPYFNLVFTSDDAPTGIKVTIDYPSGEVIRFELKIWGHTANLVISKLVPIMLREFNANFRSIYPSYSGFPLHPLKVVRTVQ